MNKYMIMAVDRPPSRVERNILQAWIDIQIRMGKGGYTCHFENNETKNSPQE